MQCTPNLQLKTNVIRLIDDTIRKLLMNNILICEANYKAFRAIIEQKRLTND